MNNPGKAVQGGLFGSGPALSLDLDSAVRKALRIAFRSGKKSRQEIADHMSLLSGRQISVSVLDSFTAESKATRRFPAAWLPAFCAAADDCEVMRLLVESVGFRMIDSAEAALIDLGRAYLERKRATEKMEELEDRLRGEANR